MLSADCSGDTENNAREETGWQAHSSAHEKKVSPFKKAQLSLASHGVYSAKAAVKERYNVQAKDAHFVYAQHTR